MPGSDWFAKGVAVMVFLAPLLAVPVRAEPWNTPYDRFFEDPKAKAEFKTLDDGTEVRSVLLPGGVRLEERREDGAISRYSMDTSGAGAVLCTREIFLTVQIALAVCEDLENRTVSNRLDEALGRVDDFVVANSVEPVSLSQLHENEQARLIEFRKEMRGASDEEKVASCRSVDEERFRFRAEISRALGSMSDEDFRKWLDHLLAVPRLPAMNPCL